MEFGIKIYGAPYGFDLFDGTEQELNYFQLFDNGSTEPVKMTIHRLNNNQITYNYLRYGYVTSGGRTGSFFGMSVVFQKAYCADFTRMYQLFDAVYGTIVKNAILLENLPQGQWQAKYKIQKFAEATNEIERIKGVLGQNIQGTLAKDIKPIEFPSTTSGDREFHLSDNTDNIKIFNSLSKYSIVTISPVYNNSGSGEVETVSLAVLMKLPKEKRELISKANDWTNKVNSFQTNFRALKDTDGEVRQLSSQYESIMTGLDGFILKMEKVLTDIHKWRKIEPSRPLLIECQNDITASKENLASLYSSMRLYNNVFTSGSSSSGSKSGSGSSGTDSGSDKKPSPFALILHKHKTKIIAASSVIVLVIVALVLFYPKDSEQKNTPNPTEVFGEQHMTLARQAIEDASNNPQKWVEAYQHCDSIIKYNDTIDDKYSRLTNTKDTLKMCQDKYHSYVLSYPTPSNFPKKEKAIQFYKDNIVKVGLEEADNEIEQISLRYNTERPSQTEDSKNKGKTTTKTQLPEKIIWQVKQGKKDSVPSGVPLTFECTSKLPPGCKVKWFLDKKEIGTEKKFTYTSGLKIGSYTVTCTLVLDGQTKSCPQDITVIPHGL